jgi:hypothetical protein
MTPATLAVKGGTIGPEMTRKFGLKVASLTLLLGFLLHAANLRHGTGFYFPPEGRRAAGLFRPEKSDGFGRV